MIVRKLEDIQNSPRDVRAPTFSSRRFLLRNDGMGFSLHDTVLYAGTETLIWYKNHLEAVYCIEGEAEVFIAPDGPGHRIVPGTLYALDQHEKHHLRVKTDFRAICIFSPPLTGQEVHDEEGAYPLIPASEEPAAGD